MKEKRASRVNGSFQYIKLLLLTVCLYGCADTVKYPPVNLETITIQADQDANINSPIPFDLLVAYNPGAFDEIAKLTARDYFKKRDQILNDNPNMVQIWHWELVPGQRIQNLELKRGGARPAGALIFANYITAGDHRIRVGTQYHMNVRLLNQGMQVVQ